VIRLDQPRWRNRDSFYRRKVDAVTLGSNIVFLLSDGTSTNSHTCKIIRLAVAQE